jgi:hypothetical protein
MTIYAVNGKEPVAAWIPSLDTAGNGTTTLTDLVGSNDGTLTNMDAATDWVSDTSNGGVRALDFDGSNDWIAVNGNIIPNQSYLTSFSHSAWIYVTSVPATRRTLGLMPAINTSDFAAEISIVSGKLTIDASKANVANVRASQASNILTNQWLHVAGVWSATQQHATLYVNSNLEASVNYTAATISANAVNSTSWFIATENFAGTNGIFFLGRIDDIRIFDTALDATDIAYLYNSGNGRGIVATTPNTRRRRYAGGYGL